MLNTGTALKPLTMAFSVTAPSASVSRIFLVTGARIQIAFSPFTDSPFVLLPLSEPRQMDVIEALVTLAALSELEDGQQPIPHRPAIQAIAGHGVHPALQLPGLHDRGDGGLEVVDHLLGLGVALQSAVVAARLGPT